MTTEFTDLSTAALVWLATYLVHSTLLLGLAWLATRVIGQRSFALQDQIWKLALVLPLLTATIQQAAGPSPMAAAQWTLTWPDEPTDSTTLPARVARPDHRDGRGSQVESAVSGMPREQPFVSVAFDSEVSQSAADRETQSTTGASTSGTDWTIDIQPGPVELAGPVRPETAVLVSDGQIAIEANEELRGGGDEERSFAEQPVPSHLSSSPHPLISSLRPPRLLTAAGALICLYLAFAAFRLLALAWKERRRLAAMVSGDDGPGRCALDPILASHGIRRPVQLLYSRSVRCPAACGWWRWRIVLPAGLDHETPQDELRALLAHELAHLVRRDTIWLWWSHALCILLPVQPLNFLARRRWEEAAEYLCDAWAVEADVQPLTMAKCLTRVADRSVRGATPIGVTAVGRQSTLSRRIERLTAGRIARPQHARATRVMALVITLVVAAAIVVGAPQVSLTGEKVSPAKPASDSEANFAPRDEEMRRRGDEELDSSPALDARKELQNELQTLLTDLDRLNELLAQVDDPPELVAAREQMQRRLRRIRDRGFGAIDESNPDAPGVRVTVQPSQTSELDLEISP